MFSKYIYVFFISMLPLIELRGAIPYSQVFGLPLLSSYIVAIIGNMLPVPLIYFLARKFLNWGSEKRLIGSICRFFLVRGENAGKKLQAKASKGGMFIALLLFVGIPLPGTGAWTGTFAASILDLDFKWSVLAVTGGVLLAGVIMALASAGLLGAVGAIF